MAGDPQCLLSLNTGLNTILHTYTCESNWHRVQITHARRSIPLHAHSQILHVLRCFSVQTAINAIIYFMGRCSIHSCSQSGCMILQVREMECQGLVPIQAGLGWHPLVYLYLCKTRQLRYPAFIMLPCCPACLRLHPCMHVVRQLLAGDICNWCNLLKLPNLESQDCLQ